MTAIVKVQSNQLADFADKVKAGDAGYISKLLKATMAMYGRTNGMLHHTACAVLHHAMRYGNTTPLNEFYKGLMAARPNDANALRVWLGVASAVPKDGEENVNKLPKTLVFNKENGFGVNKGIAPVVREGLANLDSFLAMDPFYRYDIRKEEVGKGMSLEDLLKVLKTALDKAQKMESEQGVQIPAHIHTVMVDMERAISSTNVRVILENVEAA